MESSNLSLRDKLDKSDDLVRKCISKAVQCILLSRVDVITSQKKINKNFHIETEESESIQKMLDSVVFARNGIKTLFLLDIHFDENNEMLGFNTIVESWRFTFDPFKEVDSTFELPKLYKHSILFIRALYSLLRNLPCHRVYRNFLKNRTSTSKVKYQIRICDNTTISSPSFPLSTPTKSFTFSTITTPVGIMKLDVSYKDNLQKELTISSQLSLDSQFIIKDYKTNNDMHVIGSSGGGVMYTPSQSLPIKHSNNPLYPPTQHIQQPQQQQVVYPPQPQYGSQGRGGGGGMMDMYSRTPNSAGSNESNPLEYYPHPSSGSGGGGGYIHNPNNFNQPSSSSLQQQLVYNNNNNQQDIYNQDNNNNSRQSNSNPIFINQNNQNTGLYSIRKSPTNNNNIINGSGSGAYMVSPSQSTSPPFYMNQINQNVGGGAGSGGNNVNNMVTNNPNKASYGTSPPFYTNQPQPPQSQPQPQQPIKSNTSTIPIRQINFTPPPQPLSPNSGLLIQQQHMAGSPLERQQQQQQQQGPLPIFSQPQSFQTNTHRNRSTSAPITVPPHQQQQQLVNNLVKSNKTPPYNQQQYPFDNNTNFIYDPSTGTSTPTNTSGTLKHSSGIHQQQQPMCTSPIGTINSKLSQIHGPLLVSDIHRHQPPLGNMMTTNTNTGSMTQLTMDMGGIGIENDEPVFASSIANKTQTIDSEVGEFIRLCKLAPPLKLFDSAITIEPPIRLDQDIIELNHFNLEFKK